MGDCPNNCNNCHEDCDSKVVKLSKSQTWVILLLIAVIGCAGMFFSRNTIQKRSSVRQFSYPCMGTVVNVSFYEDEKIAENAAKAVYSELKKIENMCNIFNTSSEISRLNKNAAAKPFVCSKDLYDLLLKCKKAHHITRGAFDITAKPLMKLWGFYARRKNTPSPTEISKTLEIVGLDKVRFNDAERSVLFTVEGMSIDLGGVAKGYALDAAAAAAKNAGASDFMINLGGNIACFRKNPSDAYAVGIRDPRKRDAVAKKLRLVNSFCATSGNYERFVVLKGKRYSHIMNPLTGYPIQNMYSATAVCKKGIDSDIFSTACFILGERFADELVKRNIADNIFLIYPDENNSLTLKNITREEIK